MRFAKRLDCIVVRVSHLKSKDEVWFPVDAFQTVFLSLPPEVIFTNCFLFLTFISNSNDIS